MRKSKQKYTILIAVCGILIIATFVLLSVNYINNVSYILTKEANETLIQSTEQGERHINYAIGTDLLGLNTLATSIVNLKNESHEQIVDWLKLFVSDNGYFNIAVSDVSGVGLTAKGDYRKMDNAAFRYAAMGKTTVSYFIDKDEGNTPMMSFDVPIIKDAKVIGIISAIKKIDYLNAVLNISTTVDYANAYIINKNSEFIAIADNSDISRSMQSVDDFINNSKNSISQVQEFSTGLLLSQSYVGEMYSSGEEKIFAYTPIKGVDGWYYMMVIPKSVIHSKITDITRSSLFLLMSFIVAIAIVFIIILAYKERHTNQILNLAHIDQLTGIPNWNKFKIDCEEIIKKAKGQRFAIISCDIDSFKVVNDIYGHQEGNKILIDIAVILQKHVMLGERCSRYSVDTFLILVKYQSDEDIIQWINSFHCEACAQMASYSITMSFGVFKINDSRFPIDIMCDRANIARRTIKGDHERIYAFYEDETRRQIIEVKEIENDMHSALNNEQFTVYFQPKHSFSNNKIIGAEALVRWVHPVKGMIFPDSFIPVFERNGFVIHLDMYVLKQTCRMIRKWIDIGVEPIVISVNMSQIHLKDSHFVEDLYNLTQSFRVPPKYIEIELTESAIFENMGAFTKVVCSLKQYGFTVSMDDFGSGYSSLNLLSELQVDILKIDRMFLNKSTDSIRGKCIIESVINMAKQLGITTVSEGVETKEQFEFLRNAGCDVAQGYFFSRPITRDAFEEYMKLCEQNISKDL